MKKIQCLFQREFLTCVGGRGTEAVLRETVTQGCEGVLRGEGFATAKYDGTACMVKNDVLYKRYDAKAGKSPPAGAIPCCEPDPVTGHWPHWLPVGIGPEDKWMAAAWATSAPLRDGTYEFCGPHVQGNPYGADRDWFQPHGSIVLSDEHLPVRSFSRIRQFFAEATVPLEGLVFWRDDWSEPWCKIRRADFGLPWPSAPPWPTEFPPTIPAPPPDADKRDWRGIAAVVGRPYPAEAACLDHAPHQTCIHCRDMPPELD